MWQLRRYALNKPATLDQLGTLKHGIRTAERIIETIRDNAADKMQDWNLGNTPKNKAQELCTFLWQVIMSLTAEVHEAELQHPALKKQFDDERTSYRAMKDAADAC